MSKLVFETDAGQITLSPWLTQTFTRPVTTLDLEGNPVAANVPIFDKRSKSIAGAPVFTAVSSGGVLAIGSSVGFASDGVSQLYAAMQDNTGSVKIYTGAAPNDDPIGTPTRTVSYSASGAAPFANGTSQLRTPQSLLVAHGLIIAACEMKVSTPGTVEGTSVVWSQDDGATWGIFDQATASNGSTARGKSWQMQNWYVIKRGSVVTEIYVPITDYVDAVGGSTGKLFLLHATRAGAGQPWTVKVGEIYSVGSGITHFHSAGIVVDDSGVVYCVLAIGDAHAQNSIARGTLNSSLNDPTDSANWSFATWQGGPTVSGFQFVGCAPGPLISQLIVGADETTEALLILDGTAASAAPLRVSGPQRSLISNHEGFYCHCLTPNDPTRFGWTAILQPATSAAAPGNDARNNARAIYSTDGQAWADLASGFNATHAPVMNAPNGQTYMMSLNGAGGASKTPTPATLQSVKPLLVRPGGANKLVASPTTFTSGTTTTITEQSAADLLALGISNPPCFGKVYRVTCPVASDATFARFDMAGSFDVGSESFRIWVHGISDDIPTALTIQQFLSPAPSRFFDSMSASGTTQFFVSSSEWTAVDGGGPHPGPLTAVHFLVDGGTNQGTRDYLVALDFADNSAGLAGFPIRPITTAADELFEITHPASTANAATLVAALRNPDYGPDAVWGEKAIWTLLAWYKDPDNYIVVTADMPGQLMRLDVMFNGAAAGVQQTVPSYFQRDSQILIALSYIEDVGGIGVVTVRSSVAGHVIASMESLIAGGLASFDLNTVRFGQDATNSIGQTPIEIISGFIDPAVGETGSTLENNLINLAWGLPQIVTIDRRIIQGMIAQQMETVDSSVVIRHPGDAEADEADRAARVQQIVFTDLAHTGPIEHRQTANIEIKIRVNASDRAMRDDGGALLSACSQVSKAMTRQRLVSGDHEIQLFAAPQIDDEFNADENVRAGAAIVTIQGMAIRASGSTLT